MSNIRTETDEDELERIEEERRTGSEKIKQAYRRIMEKIKKIRKSFSNAVTNGGRIVKNCARALWYSN